MKPLSPKAVTTPATGAEQPTDARFVAGKEASPLKAPAAELSLSRLVLTHLQTAAHTPTSLSDLPKELLLLGGMLAPSDKKAMAEVTHHTREAVIHEDVDPLARRHLDARAELGKLRSLRDSAPASARQKVEEALLTVRRRVGYAKCAEVQAHEWAMAVRRDRDALLQDPHDFGSAMQLSFTLARAGQYYDAVDAQKHYLRVCTPRDLQSGYQRLAFLLLQSGRPLKAIELVTQMRAELQDHPGTRTVVEATAELLATALVLEGDISGARTELQHLDEEVCSCAQSSSPRVVLTTARWIR